MIAVPQRLRRATALLAASSVAALGLAAAAPAALAASATTTFPGSVPSWATSANDAGTTAAATTVEGEIYLPLRDPQGARQFVEAVSTPGHPTYRHFLSPADWRKKFSPTQSDVDAVVAYVKSHGGTITAVPKSRQYVVFRAPASAMDAAFGTTLHQYRHDGHTLTAPSSAPKLPAALAGKVSGISIDQSRLLTRPTYVTPETGIAATASATAKPTVTPPVTATCSDYYGEHYAKVPAPTYFHTQFATYICGYTPGQLRSAYGLDKTINAGTDGTGQTVAIVDAYASPTIVDDTRTYAQLTGTPTLVPSRYQQIVPDPSDFTDQDLCAGPSGWQGEQTLDVESAHGVAPGAKILYVGGTNCGGGLDVALSKILDDKLANIVSNSYGYVGEAVSPDAISGELNQHLQAAAEGIGLYFSSGDNGDEKANLGYTSPDFPASSPYVTSVGGTSLAVGAAGDYIFETGWGSARAQYTRTNGELTYTTPAPGPFRFGAGGGTSALFAQPAYQAGVVPSSLATGSDGTASRVSPDIASLADPYTGFLIGIRPIVDDSTLETAPFVTETYGGTSLASPLTAAQMALGQAISGQSVGFANPTLYAAYQKSTSGFRDVTPPATNQRRALTFSSTVSGGSYLVTLDSDSSLSTAKGYDDVTGLGSPTIAGFARVASGRP